MGHGRRTLLPLGEGLLDLADLGPLEMADLDGDLLDGRREQGQGGEDLGVAVPLQDLVRDVGGPELELFQGHDLDPGVDGVRRLLRGPEQAVQVYLVGVDEAAGQTLQPTALVHEAYIRLVDGEKGQVAHECKSGM